ncbi:MAG: glycoside hydrolase family 65 protein [Spirochaetales bacterium]
MIDDSSEHTADRESGRTPGTRSFPLDSWQIIEDDFDLREVPSHETVFALGNGYLGVRGSFEERRGLYNPGTYLNGFYDTESIVYGERAYGFARNKQRMLNVTDGTYIGLWVDEDPLDLSTGTTRSYRRWLDLQSGLLTRRLEWVSPSGIALELETVRMVSFLRPHLTLIDWKCRLLDRPAYVVVISGLDKFEVARSGVHDPRVGESMSDALLLRRKFIGEQSGYLRYRTRRTGTDMVCTMHNDFETNASYSCRPHSKNGALRHRYKIKPTDSTEIRLRKYVCYYHSYDAEESRLKGLSDVEVERARASGVDMLAAEQRMYLDEFWTSSDIQIDGDPWLQQSLRFNLFHVLQATGRDGRTNIGAKGLTGEGYEGHYFWDTEIYALPFYTYTTPFIARRLLLYRYNILPKARDRAAELSHPGALYPWRTINGEEASAYYPAGTAQYHLNADIIYALRQYIRATGDEVFLRRFGAEMLFETARFYYDLGDYIPERGFCINMVTGPNEYTALINNNVFTNMMVQDHLQWAADVANWLRDEHVEDFQRLSGSIGLSESEVASWSEAAEAMFIPYDERRKLYPQDDSFFMKHVWNFHQTPPSRYPLLLHYHPLNIYRYQVCKQPDVVLALLLQGWRFDDEHKRRNFDYYDALNTGDSSLSSCIQSIIAAELGYVERAYEYFMKTARMDLDDINGNVRDGIHFANMAGCWMSLVYGFGGMRDWHGRLRFSPRLPKKWSRISFRVRLRDTLIELQIRRDGVTYSIVEGDSRTIYHEEEALELVPGTPVTRELPDIRPDFMKRRAVSGD